MKHVKKPLFFLSKLRDVTNWLLYVTVLSLLPNSCNEEINKSNRFTFTGLTIAGWLEKNADTYSDFISIIKHAGHFRLLSTYGSYTCFAPSNEAIERYLFEQDSVYHASLHEGKVVNTGITSPYLEDLSDSMATVIAQSHLIEQTYHVADMYEGVLEKKNFNDRFLTVSFDVKDERYRVLINNQAVISEPDIEAENGTIQAVNRVISPSSDLIGDQIAKHSYFNLFYTALSITGMEDSLQLYKDYTYNLQNVVVTDYEGGTGTVNYPGTRYFKYTVFAETDETYAKYGIGNIGQLIEYARSWYGNEDADNYRSRKNALNRFISYHLLDREVPYNRLVCHNLKMTNFDSEKNYVQGADRYEYFETMLPNTLCKTIKVLSNSELSRSVILNLNRRGKAYNEKMDKHLSITIIPVTEFATSDEKYSSFDGNALNGTIHVIDKIMVYNEDEMAGNVMNERMRFDFASLMPEVVTNGVKFCPWGAASKSGSNHMSIAIPANYSKNYKSFSEGSALHYLCANTSWCDYQGDEFICIGKYDIAYKLPPVPPGSYEIRLGYTAYPSRGVAQFYIDNEVTGIPVDLRRMASEPEIGWIADAATDDNGIENDKAMRNRGYMKGPNIYIFGGANLIARNYSGSIRRIVTTKYLTKGDHWIRFKNVQADDNGTAEFMHDYLEIVPMTVIRSVEPEDRK